MFCQVCLQHGLYIRNKHHVWIRVLMIGLIQALFFIVALIVTGNPMKSVHVESLSMQHLETFHRNLSLKFRV